MMVAEWITKYNNKIDDTLKNCIYKTDYNEIEQIGYIKSTVPRSM